MSKRKARTPSAGDLADRRKLAELLMVEITVRLESLADAAARRQRARALTSTMQEGVAAVETLLRAHDRMLE